MTENELMRERGLWGPPFGSELDKWKLDVTEGKPSLLNEDFNRLDGSSFIELFLCHGWAARSAPT